MTPGARAICYRMRTSATHDTPRTCCDLKGHCRQSRPGTEPTRSMLGSKDKSLSCGLKWTRTALPGAGTRIPKCPPFGSGMILPSGTREPHSRHQRLTQVSWLVSSNMYFLKNPKNLIAKHMTELKREDKTGILFRENVVAKRQRASTATLI